MSRSAHRLAQPYQNVRKRLPRHGARYAEEMMRHSSEAGRALLRSRNLSEILEVQVQLLRDDMEGFLDQSIKVAEAVSRMAARAFGY